MSGLTLFCWNRVPDWDLLWEKGAVLGALEAWTPASAVRVQQPLSLPPFLFPLLQDGVERAGLH